MSVVVKDGQTGKIHLLSKGADEAILPRAYPGNGTTMKSALCHDSCNIEFSLDAWILYALSDQFAYYNILCPLLNLFIMGYDMVRLGIARRTCSSPSLWRL
jgi:hypothetical protein